MHQLELQAVGIGEEDGVVVGAVLGIFGGRVEDGQALLDEPGVEAIDVGTRAARSAR